MVLYVLSCSERQPALETFEHGSIGTIKAACGSRRSNDAAAQLSNFSQCQGYRMFTEPPNPSSMLAVLNRPKQTKRVAYDWIEIPGDLYPCR